MMKTTSSRRRFLRQLSFASLAGAAGPTLLPKLAAEEKGKRPNMLFILIDDLRWDALGYMNHPFVKTPAIDRIRREGASFDNTFVTTSLCSPARASFLTGTYAHTHGVTGNNGLEFDPKATPSFPMLLQESGYNTAFVGKWHMGRHANPRPGFDYWLSFVGQGKIMDPPLNENGRSFQKKGHMTDLLNGYAENWLRNHRDPGKPFCLYLGHKAVHQPFTPPERHKQLFAEEQLPEPPNWRDTFAGKPRWLREVGTGRHGIKRSSMLNKQKNVREAIPPIPWKGGGNWKNQLKMIQSIDDGVDRLLKTLEELGILDETVIIFTSDNGYFHGEHRRGDKRLMYEESLRIPFAIRYPPLIPPGSTIRQMILNIDVAPSLLDFAGLPPHPKMQGKSFLPLLQSPQVGPWRHSFLYEYWVDLTPAIPDMVGVRTDNWKLIHYPNINDIDELYDLSNDPAEMTNLAQKPEAEAKHAEMKQELHRLMRETQYRPPKKQTAPIANDGGQILAFDFSQKQEGKIIDKSGQAHHGKLRNGTFVNGRANRQALKFTGKTVIELPHYKTLDPALTQWTVSAWVKPEAPNGVLLAQGGLSLGYMLFLEQGKPAFALRNGRELVIADALEPCLNKWTHLAGVIGNRELSLYVDGECVGTIPVKKMIPRLPNDSLQIGKDQNSPIFDKSSTQPYRGLLESISIHKRGLGKEEISRMGKKNNE